MLLLQRRLQLELVHQGVHLTAQLDSLPSSFFARDARIVARALIGTQIVVLHEAKTGGPRLGRIVETEAYRGPTDLASHARFGVTKRTRSMFLGPGHAYVFFVYGLHECFNVTCLREGAGHAVLVRAVELVDAPPGEKRRGDGPGRLTRALGIDRRHDGLDVTGDDRLSPISLRPRPARGPGARPKIGVSARVGVAYAGEIAEAPWRFFDRESRQVSRPPASAIGLGKKANVSVSRSSSARSPSR